MAPSAVSAAEVQRRLREAGSPERARGAARYFKTGPGEYGEGDVFVGASVPAQRAIARACRGLARSELDLLLRSPVHEERLTALLGLCEQHAHGDAAARASLSRYYLSRLRRVNNWDLVDVSAPTLLGEQLVAGDHALLDELAASRDVWSRRVAMVATFARTRRGDATAALHVATRLLYDEHDLIQKAVGWMLREVGKRAGIDALEAFLEQHAATMPRTALRYAIERFPKAERDAWLARRAQARLLAPGREGYR